MKIPTAPTYTGIAFLVNAAIRDVGAGMDALLYTTRLSKAEYLGGRFLAALVLNALILLAVQAGILLAVYSPGVDAEIIGPFPGGVRLDLELVEERRFGNGVVVLRYTVRG